MKILKVTVLAFLFTAVLSAVSANANVKGYADVTIPRFQGQKTVGRQVKDNFGVQKFEKITCIDKLSGNEMAIQVQTYSVNYGTFVQYVDAPKNVLKTISSSNHTAPGDYKLNAKAKNSFVTEGRLWGTWVLN